MSRKSLLKSESAAAIAIAAVLLLGLAFTIISVVKINYVPEWKIDAERDYSYDAWSSMEDVKTRGDIFTRFMESDANYPYGLSATVPFSMGGGDIPVFEPSKSNSKLAVNTEECTMNITFGNHTLDPVKCGGITYYSENRQYPNQVFRYENGALILAQENKSQMKRNPLFNITEDMGNYTVTIGAINLTGEPKSVSSSTLTALRLTGCFIDPILNTDVYMKADETINTFNLSISTHYIDAWATYFNNTAKNAGLEYDTDYKITYPDSNCVCLSFLPTGNNNYTIYVNQTVLCAELGRGSCIDNEGINDSESEEEEDEPGSELAHGNRIILNKNGFGGIVSSGTYIQFTNNGNNNDYWVEIDGSKKKLKKGEIVKLIIDGDQTAGSADMNANTISNFNFNVEMYIDGKSVKNGIVTDIWVSGYSDYESTLTYRLPPYLSGTQLQVDGDTIISSWPENDSAINLYNIGPAPTNNNFLTITFDTGNTYFDCSADYEIVSS